MVLTILLEHLLEFWNFFSNALENSWKNIIFLYSWKTPGILKFFPWLWKTPGKADDFPVLLENSWNFKISFQRPETKIIFLYSWKTPGISNFLPGPWNTTEKKNFFCTPGKLLEFCGKLFINFINKPKPTKVSDSLYFCNYFISFVFAERSFWFGSTLESSWMEFCYHQWVSMVYEWSSRLYSQFK